MSNRRTTLAQYLESLREQIVQEAKAELALRPHADFDELIEGITDAYAQGFCDDQQAREYGDYPYDGSMDDYRDDYPDTRSQEY